MNKIAKAALAKVNQARRACGWPELTVMPSGFQQSAAQCPIARALTPPGGWTAVCQEYIDFDDPQMAQAVADAWGGTVIFPLDLHSDGASVRPLPPELVAFIKAFDRGEISSEEKTNGAV